MGPSLSLVLASRNAGKLAEFRRLFGREVTIAALPPGVPMPPETGVTFADNARLKAESTFEALGGVIAVLADDSGLEVTALGGRPGVRSARYAGEAATDARNLALLLEEMRGQVDRRARFVCALGLVLSGRTSALSGRTSFLVTGTVEGWIEDAPRGTGGFGYDPIFRPQGWERTLAEVTGPEKDRVSHRAAAVAALRRLLLEEGVFQDG